MVTWIYCEQYSHTSWSLQESKLIDIRRWIHPLFWDPRDILASDRAKLLVVSLWINFSANSGWLFCGHTPGKVITSYHTDTNENKTLNSGSRSVLCLFVEPILLRLFSYLSVRIKNSVRVKNPQAFSNYLCGTVERRAHVARQSMVSWSAVDIGLGTWTMSLGGEQVE